MPAAAAASEVSTVPWLVMLHAMGDAPISPFIDRSSHQDGIVSSIGERNAAAIAVADRPGHPQPLASLRYRRIARNVILPLADKTGS